MKQILTALRGAAGYLGLLFAGSAVAVLPFVVTGHESGRVGGILSALLALGLALLWLRRKKQDVRKRLYLNRVGGRTLLWMVAATACVTLAVEALPLFMPKSWMQGIPQEVYTAYPALDILSIVIISPPVEEVFFRALMLPKLMEGMPEKAAVAASAVIFAIMHQGIVWMILALCMSVWYSFLFLKTKSLIPCIAAHMTSNLLAVAFHFLV